MILEAKDIGLQFGPQKTPVFEGLSFQIDAGQDWRITGPSGAGKTSLLRIMAGLGEPSSGRVTRHFARPAFAFAEPRLIQHLEVIENLRFVQPDASVETLQTYLSLLNLRDFGRARADKLSKGQAQRVAMIRALIVRPDVLFLDEALSGLDDASFGAVKELVVNYRKNSPLTLIEVGHDASRILGDKAAATQIPLALDPS